MYSLPEILDMNREVTDIKEPVTRMGTPRMAARTSDDPVKAFLKRKALLGDGVPRGDWLYGDMHPFSPIMANTMLRSHMTVEYYPWQGTKTGVMMKVGNYYTLYWIDPEMEELASCPT